MSQRRSNLDVLMEDLVRVEECFTNPTRTPNWTEVKKFVCAPVAGEGQIGRTLADIEDAIRHDREKDFWQWALIGVRMMRRQRSPMGEEKFGER